MPDEKQQGQRGSSRPPSRQDKPNAQTGVPGAPTRPTGEPSQEEREQFRQPTFWYNQKDRETSFRMEDARWATGEQIKDWIKLLIMVALTVGWGLFIYFLAPGLR